MDKSLFKHSNKVQTTCDPCVFKVEENGEQTGCMFNRLSVYKKQNKAEKVDNSYLIDGFCSRCRNNDALRVKNMQFEQYFKYIKQVTTVTMSYIIYHDNTKTLNDLLKTIDSINNQTINNFMIHIVIDKETNGKNIIDKLESMKIRFLLHKVFGQETPELSVDIAAKKCLSQYIMFVESGNTIDKRVNEKLDSKINDDLEKVLMVLPEPGYEKYDNIIVQTHLYNLLRGNENVVLIKKLEFLIENQPDDKSLSKEYITTMKELYEDSNNTSMPL